MGQKIDKDQMIICLNTRTVYATFEKAAEYIGSDVESLEKVCDERTYRKGEGRHPKTGEKLYWIRFSKYIPGIRYLDGLVALSERDKRVICINTLEIFESEKQAREWCENRFQLRITNFVNGLKVSSGKHPETGEKLYWKMLRECGLNEAKLLKKELDIKSKVIVCLNNKKMFGSYEEAAEYANVTVGNLKSKSYPTTYDTGVGEDPKTGETLYWLHVNNYDDQRDYLAEIKSGSYQTSGKSGVVCLNTSEVFQSFEIAAKWCGVKATSIMRNCGSGNYTRGVGQHPKTGERLYWYNNKMYVPDKDYGIKGLNKARKMSVEKRRQPNIDYVKTNQPVTAEEPSKRVYCLNTGQGFESFEEAGKWAKIVHISEIKRNSTFSKCVMPVGEHPETSEKLHWLREEFYKDDVDYSYLFTTSKR